MKNVKEITCCVVDYGSFIELADCLSKVVKKQYYYSPCEEEFEDVKSCVIGDGLDKVERVDEPLSPEMLEEVDLFVFPDIGFGGLQRTLRDTGKAVWGSFGASDMELYRTKFLETVKSCGLSTVKSVTIQGLTKLTDHLKEVKNKWIKVNRYRQNMETWYHLDFEHSQDILSNLDREFGGVRENVMFVVQDNIEDEPGAPVLEIGYDGWSVDGEFPVKSFQGYEKKNELYLGSLLDYKDLPKQAQEVNKKFSKVLKEYGYRNFFATEIRIKGKDFYFIDPTMRMAGQTMEHLFENCTNLADVIWQGANGKLIVPEFKAKFSAEATLHYTAPTNNGWRTLRVNDKDKQWFKLYHYCKDEGLYRFPPHKTDELGVVIGLGNTIEKSKEELDKNFKLIKGESVEIHTAGFQDLLKDIATAEKAGIRFK